MLTALNIEDHQSGLFHLFRHNRLRVEHLYCDSAAVKSISYEHYRGRIGWGSIDRFVKAQRDRLLCPAGLALPEESGYRRFVSHELGRRMCENAALWLLQSAGERGLRTVLVDPDGDSTALCAELVDYVDPLCVVTQAAERYIEQAEMLLSEKGAALRVSRSGGCLRDAELVIAPGRLTDDLDCSPLAVILSGEKPAVPQNAPVIYDYFFELPSKYREMLPPYLDEMYFASALYTLAGAHELGSELFRRCGDGSVIHTRNSLLKLLEP